MWYIYNGILFSHKKEGNPAICDNMDGPRGHYAKRKKSYRERYILYDLTNMWNFFKNPTEVGWGWGGVGEMGEGGSLMKKRKM